MEVYSVGGKYYKAAGFDLIFVNIFICTYIYAYILYKSEISNDVYQYVNGNVFLCMKEIWVNYFNSYIFVLPGFLVYTAHTLPS